MKANNLYPIILRSPVGDRLSNDDLVAHLGYDLDADAWAAINSMADRAWRVAQKLTAARGAYNACPSRQNFIAIQRIWLSSQWNYPVVSIWSAILQEFRILRMAVKIDGSVTLVSDRRFATTSAMMWDRRELADQYPYNTMTAEEAIAAQRAAGSRDNYWPMESLIERAIGQVTAPQPELEPEPEPEQMSLALTVR